MGIAIEKSQKSLRFRCAEGPRVFGDKLPRSRCLRGSTLLVGELRKRCRYTMLPRVKVKLSEIRARWFAHCERRCKVASEVPCKLFLWEFVCFSLNQGLKIQGFFATIQGFKNPLAGSGRYPTSALLHADLFLIWKGGARRLI